MSSDINPLRPNSTPLPNAGGAGAEGLRNQYNQRGNKGGGKDKEEKKKEEPEEPAGEAEEAAEEQGHLDADSFSGRKARSVIDNLFSESLPWEREAENEEEERAAKLEELKRKREGLAQRGGASSGVRLGSAPLGRKPGGTSPLPPPPGRPGTGSLSNVKIPPPPTDATPAPLGGAPVGRRIDENFDPTAALNSTLLAQQALRDRQLQREREEKERLAQEAQSLDAPGLAKFLRPAAGPRSPSGPLSAPADDGGMLTAPLRPEIEIAPASEARNAPLGAARRAATPPSVRPPSVDELAGTPPQVAPGAVPPRTPTGKLPPRSPAIPRPGSGKLDAAQAAGQAHQAARPQPPSRAGQAEARVPAAPSWKASPAEPSDPLPPLDALSGVLPGPDAEAVPFPGNEDDPAAGFGAASDEGAGVAAAGGSPPVVDGPPPPPVKAGKVSAACTYRIIDVGTNRPLAGARVELEPVDDDLLPNIHGQANLNGWYATEGLPPGEYRVTVRAPGYVPVFKVRTLDVGVVDDLAIFIAKP